MAAQQAGRGKGVMVIIALVAVAMLLSGLLAGAMGEAFFPGNPFHKAVGVPQPEVHLAPQQVTGPHAGDALHGGNAFTLTNTILSSLIASGVLILLFVLGTARLKVVPGRFQGFLELAVEALLGFVESVVGKERGRGLLPVIATLFLFVAFNAWIGLLPIYQSFGFLNEHGLKATLVRPAGTDLNMTLSLAIVSFFFVEGLAFKYVGFGYLGKFFRFGALLKGNIGMGLIDVFVGILELLSEFVRLVSFTFRLFGNMTAGEILLLVSAFLGSFILTDIFYGLELLVGAVQALIFAGLTLVFASIAITPHEGEHEEH